MNRGIHGFPRYRPPYGLPAIWAMAKFDGTAPSGGAGAQIEAKSLKRIYNISKIVYNGTGDYTLHFTDPFETADFVSLGSGKDGANNALLMVDASDSGLASEKRVKIVDNTGTARNSTEVSVLFVG